ncbi:MAG: DUF2309 domain-containing protein [Flavobacteriales bacterium]|nr:DUF2309 domain-containing protein [Flavobacteriales bacterium]
MNASVDHSTAAEVRSGFDLEPTLHELRHYLPAQAPLKDFIHHNTLHAFQHRKFEEGLRRASAIFGYKVCLSIREYRDLYRKGRIDAQVLRRVIAERKGEGEVELWMRRALQGPYTNAIEPRIGTLRGHWKKDHRIDLDAMVHVNLFRILNSYLDQGISIWHFPVWNKGFLASVRELQRHSLVGLVHGRRAKALLADPSTRVEDLLQLVVGDPALFEQYLFDQQFAHQGWSGLVATIEADPSSLLDRRSITLKELIHLELILEIDALEDHFGPDLHPLAAGLVAKPRPLFDPVPMNEADEVAAIWQEALEWTYYDEVLKGIVQNAARPHPVPGGGAQALFCIDDRECSFRRHIEALDASFETFGTPGFFGVEFYFRPEHGKFNTKVCPAPVTPRYLVKEVGTQGQKDTDMHFTKHTHGLLGGWLITHTLGFWSAFKLFLSIFKPSMSPGTSDSFQHMDQASRLTVECTDPSHREDGLQVGFTVEEMAQRVENVLRSIGLVERFAPVVYVVGHGASSVNNPHYAAYDCGACSGRPGSVNARVFCHMANHAGVRALLRERGIDIPDTTQFMGALHDTTRDEIAFYDEASLSGANVKRHLENEIVMKEALSLNAKERSRRFESVDTAMAPAHVHERVRRRSVSLFEPRPELNHATNALCIVGRRELTKGLFLDRRSFLNSFDADVDPEGRYLLNILNAAAPVCGGINLEYYFSRVDNQKLGAGTKLPHNVMGLVGVANGIEGDLRPGLPSQMIEVHDPVRLLIIVEHDPRVVLETIRKVAATYEWFGNEWVNLVAIHPRDRSLYRFKDGAFLPYHTLHGDIPLVDDILPLLEEASGDHPVRLLTEA